MDYTDTPQGTSIGTIGNYYGGLWIDEQDGKFFWSVENYDGCGWEEIPRSLYDELMKLKRD